MKKENQSNLKAFILLITVLIYLPKITQAQTDTLPVATDTEDSKALVIDSSKERDLADVYFTLIRKKNNFTIDREEDMHKVHFSMVPAVGYTLQTGFAGIISANWGFNASTLPTQKVSSISTSITYSQYNQTIVPFVANIWTKNNKLNLITDCRYIQYPSEIFGLGGRTDPTQGYTVNFTGLKFHQTIMKEVAENTYLGLGYYYDQFWNIKALDSLKRNVARLLDNKLGTSELASGFVMRFLYDTRLNQIFPEQGWHFDLTYRGNFSALGSDEDWQAVQTDVRTYIRLPENSRNILSFWNFNWFTTSKNSPPYLMLPSTGWDDQYNTGRGYIQGRFRGRNMFYMESEYRFRISSNGLLGGVVFGNVQYFSTDISNQYNVLSPGYGLGLRIRLNKHSNANLCVDYGFGANGSKGFFVNLGEVF